MLVLIKRIIQAVDLCNWKNRKKRYFKIVNKRGKKERKNTAIISIKMKGVRYGNSFKPYNSKKIFTRI